MPGGKFGLFSDWHEAVAMPGQDGRSASLRGESCQTEEKQNEVDEILRKAKATPDGNKVTIDRRLCVEGRYGRCVLCTSLLIDGRQGCAGIGVQCFTRRTDHNLDILDLHMPS